MNDSTGQTQPVSFQPKKCVGDEAKEENEFTKKSCRLGVTTSPPGSQKPEKRERIGSTVCSVRLRQFFWKEKKISRLSSDNERGMYQFGIPQQEGVAKNWCTPIFALDNKERDVGEEEVD